MRLSRSTRSFEFSCFFAMGDRELSEPQTKVGEITT
jgi:hypothetical protein